MQVVVCPHCQKEIIIRPFPHDCPEKREAERIVAALLSSAGRIVTALDHAVPGSGRTVKFSAAIQDGKSVFSEDLSPYDGELDRSDHEDQE